MSDVTVLRADRWLDIDAGEVKSPAVIVVQGNRIAAINPSDVPPTGDDIDLGDVTLLPGLMDMELNLLIGGPGGPEGLPDPITAAVRDDPVFRTLRGTQNALTTLMAGFTTCRNLGLMVKSGGYLLDVALMRAIDNGWIPGPRIYPARSRHHPHRRPPGPDHVPAHCAGRDAAQLPGGHRQRGARGAPGGALPGQVRGQADQDLRQRRGDVALHAPRRPAVLGRGVRGPSSTRPTGRVSAAPPTAIGGPGDPRLHPCRRRLHRARLPGRRRDAGPDWSRRAPSWWPPPPLAEGMAVERAAPRLLQAKAAYVFPGGQAHAGQGHREGREDRLRLRRAGHPPRKPGPGALGDGQPGHDAAPGPARRPPWSAPI